MIGEGAVRHHLDRQKTLKRLRHKGVLLAINSKNDAKNVHWAGAALSADDFVSSQINWSPKLQNMRRIAEELNLKTKDFLFLDDRADERAMVTETMPEVVALDAESPAVWRRLSLAADLLPAQSGNSSWKTPLQRLRSSASSSGGWSSVSPFAPRSGRS